MRKIKILLILVVFGLGMFILGSGEARAVSSSPEVKVATESAEASESAEATASGIVEKVVEKKPDLTEPEGEVKSQLEKVLVENPVGKLRWYNPIRWMMFEAVKNGVPVNTIVLLLLFPLIVGIVAASRHLLGLRVLGLLTPSLLAVSFLATDFGVGILLFVIILLFATLARNVLKKMKLQYLPRMALLLWFISFGVFVAFVVASYFEFSGFLTVGIFPILILILLAESFIDIQIGRSYREATKIIVTTFILAFIGSYIVGLSRVQKMVVLYPELVFLGVGVFDYFIARYVGLRLSEYLKFRQIISGPEPDEEE